jgi:methyl-accepting chemotaxis protein
MCKFSVIAISLAFVLIVCTPSFATSFVGKKVLYVDSYHEGYTVAKPINNVVAGLKDAAEGEGDLTKRLDVKRRDKVGDLGRWFDVFIGNVQEIIRDVAGNANRLSDSSQNLSAISGQMSSGAEQTTLKARTVASSTGEMTVTRSTPKYPSFLGIRKP